jgi:GT2 family glycosyltransferase
MIRSWANGPLPAAAIGRWCRVDIRGPSDQDPVLVSISFLQVNGEMTGDLLFLSGRRRGAEQRAEGILFVPADAVRFAVETLVSHPPVGEATVVLRPLTQMAAALALLAINPGMARTVALSLLRGRWKSARRELSRMATSHYASNHPRDYLLWITTSEAFPDPAELPGRTVSGLVYGDPDSAAFAATARSLSGQTPPVVGFPASEGGASRLAPDSYALILQAGEVVAPGGVAAGLAELHRLGYPAIATADYDHIDAGGRRCDPSFGPSPNHVAMLSGSQTRGAWFVRAGSLPDNSAVSEGGLWAEPVRMMAWLDSYRARDPGRTVRLPFILSRRTVDTGSAPAALMARFANEHLAAIGAGLRVHPVMLEATPVLRLAVPSPRQGQPVSVVIPSTLTAPHFMPCLRKLLSLTTTPEIEVVVAVGQARDLDDAQRRAAAMAERDRRVRVVHLPMPSFNYSAVNNQAAALTRHELLLLLNDDVEPIESGWLDHMAAHLDDPAVGIAGPRLLYPDGTVQHGGVLMGLGGPCDHASRGLPGNAPGPGGRVTLDQALSAVTGACLLIRRAIFDAVGGLDEAYPSAFNDIDLCMKVRAAGRGVVYAGSVALTHHELQTYVSHYAGRGAPQLAADVARFRRMWVHVIEADPFHNPNLALTRGAEWDPAFPPRISRWRARDQGSDFNAFSPTTESSSALGSWAETPASAFR